MNDSDIFCAVIADIKRSTEMEIIHRFEVQKLLKEQIKEYNKQMACQLAAKIDFSGGDQIQALFCSYLDAYNFACTLREDMYPTSFRIGIGLGTWTIRVPGASTNEQDGTAYHHARKAIDRADHKCNNSIIFHSENKMDSIINVLIGNEDRIFQEQTKKQKMISKLYSELHPINPSMEVDSQKMYTIAYRKGHYIKLAEKLGVSRQNISQQMKSGKINEQRELKAAVAILLNLCCNTTHSGKNMMLWEG